MKAILRSAFLALAIMALAVLANAGPLEDGQAAYSRGDYATALRLWRPLAEQGFAVAQSNLGVMYAEGRGVPQDYAEAVRWYRLAAEQGFDEAQTNLGFMYHNGRGVPQDYVLEHMWHNLATAHGSLLSGNLRDDIALMMTPDQIAEAERMAREWMAKHQR